MSSRIRLRWAAVFVAGLGMLAAYAAVSNAPPPAGAAAARGLPNFAQVSTNLYRGAQPEEPGYAALAGLGVRTVVNLRSEHADRIPAGCPLRPVRIPMKADKPQLDDVRAFLREVTTATNLPAFVHCRRGADRTGLMVASYRIVVQGWDKAKAVDEMKNGGFEFFAGYRDIVALVESLDAPALRAELGLPEPAAP